MMKMYEILKALKTYLSDETSRASGWVRWMRQARSGLDRYVAVWSLYAPSWPALMCWKLEAEVWEGATFVETKHEPSSSLADTKEVAWLRMRQQQASLHDKIFCGVLHLPSTSQIGGRSSPAGGKGMD